MSLNYKFKNGVPKKMTGDECFAVCMWMMVCGVQEITDTNLIPFYNRIKVLKSVDSVSQKGLPDFDRLKMFVGLSTNVSELTPAKFLKKLNRDVDLRGWKGSK